MLVKGKLLCPSFFPPFGQFGAAPLESYVAAQANARQGIGSTLTRLFPDPTHRNAPTLSQFDCIKHLVTLLIWQHSGNAPNSALFFNQLQRTAVTLTTIQFRL